MSGSTFNNTILISGLVVQTFLQCPSALVSWCDDSPSLVRRGPLHSFFQ